MVCAGRARARIGTPVFVPGPSLPPLGGGQPRPKSRCRYRAAEAETRYSSAPHSTRRRKINGLCVAWKQRKAFSQRTGPAPSHLSRLSGTAAASRRPAVAAAGLESRRPCGQYAQSSHVAPSQVCRVRHSLSTHNSGTTAQLMTKRVGALARIKRC